MMIQVDDVLLSEALFEAYFVCDLAACKGACCIEGDAGAPLNMEELNLIDENLNEILPFLTEEGKQSIQDQGAYSIDNDGEFVTMLNRGKECSFTIYDEKGTAKCGMEEAHRQGKSNFKKPISCHLYPIRVSQLKMHEALNYHQWNICQPACDCGSKLQVKVYQFLKEALIRKYSAEWYDQLIEVDKLLSQEKTKR